MADFTVGFFLTAIDYLIVALISGCGYLLRQIYKIAKQFRPIMKPKAISRPDGICAMPAAELTEKTEIERDAVKVLMSLGLSRQESERRVAQVIATYGSLPIEELLRKAFC